MYSHLQQNYTKKREEVLSSGKACVSQNKQGYEKEDVALPLYSHLERRELSKPSTAFFDQLYDQVPPKRVEKKDRVVEDDCTSSQQCDQRKEKKDKDLTTNSHTSEVQKKKMKKKKKKCKESERRALSE